jgi:hypothetical protein
MKIDDALALPNAVGPSAGTAPGAVNVTLSRHGQEPLTLTYHPLNGANPSNFGVSLTEAAKTDPDTDEAIVGAAIESSGF